MTKNPPGRHINRALRPHSSPDLHEIARVSRLIFKCEDYNIAGVAIGPLFADIEQIGAVRSVEYVTITEAIRIASALDVPLVES